MGKLNDLTGKTFGNWKVLERAGSDKHGYATWLCECQCEKHTRRAIRGSYLLNGESQSCGCISYKLCADKVKTHGQSKTRLYGVWCHMIARTTNPNCKDYPDYGARGIKMCKEWRHDFVAFKHWAEENGYADELSIERKDVNKGYCPENCCWIMMEQQSRNRRNTHWIEFNGKTQTAKEWSKESNIPYKTLLLRLYKLGWSIEEALTIPPKVGQKTKSFSEEHRKKLGEVHKGKKHSEESRRKTSKTVLCVETNTIYYGIKEAERQTGVVSSSISRCCKGENKTAGGFHWKYIDEKQEEKR